MRNESPVHVEVTSPLRFDRIQLLLRIFLAIALGWVGITGGWVVCLLYAALPLIAAIAISSRGGGWYAAEVGPRVWRVLGWLLQLSAFMMLLVDRFPTGEEDEPVQIRMELHPVREPTAGSALLRLLTSIPSGFVLMVLWFVSAVLWVIAALFVLLGSLMPRSILGFQRGVLRWQARLVAYHASLVDEYPPFSLDTEDGGPAELAASRVL